MSRNRKLAQILFSIATILSMALSLVGTDKVCASPNQQSGDSLKRVVNSHTGKLGFLSSDNVQPASAQILGIAPYSALNQLLPSRTSRSFDPAMSLVQRYGPEFGLQNPSRELSLMRTDHPGGSRVVTRYQQMYKGIPIMAGELIINTNTNGDLYSMSGDLSPDLSLSINPSIAADTAQQSALVAMSKYYQRLATDFKASAPALWIYDAGIFQPDSKLPPQLVWRMNVTPLNSAEPINELVLVNAKTGNISLHFNQVDTVLQTQLQDDPTDTPADTATDIPTDVPTATETTLVPTSSPQPTNTTIIPTHTLIPSTSSPLPTKTAVAPTPTLIPITRNTATPTGSLNINNIVINPATSITRYVRIGGNDFSNTCANSSSPCLTIQQAVNESNPGDTIDVASGVYKGPFGGSVVTIGKSVTLNGGWNSTFTAQTGASTIDGIPAGYSQSFDNGISITGGLVTMDQFIIQHSSMQFGDGGGIHVWNATLMLTRSTVQNNTADNRGAGIFLTDNSSLTMINSTIAGNTAKISGGGIYVDGPTTGTVTIQYSTIANNAVTSSAGTGGGISLPSTGTIIDSTIIAQNIVTNTANGPDCYGTINTSSYNIIGNTTGCTVSAGTGDQFNVNPQMANSLTGTPPAYALLPGSPAINAGDSGICPSGTISTDEQGTSRPQGSGCDIGAYELAGAGIPTFISASNGNNQQTPVTEAFANPMAVQVLDGLGAPISGLTITFTAPSSGASGTFANTGNNIETDTTNSSGIATSSVFTANSSTGTYAVKTTISGSAITFNFSLQNLFTPGVPMSISVYSGDNQQTPIGQAFANQLSVVVKDGNGTPVGVGIQVTFTASSSGAGGTFANTGNNTETDETDSNGIATSSTFTANSTRGPVSVSASASGVASPANFSLNIAQLYFVDAARPDDNGGCTSPATACQTIQGAVTIASSGDIIYVTTGTYTGSGTNYVVNISKSLTILGGWDSTFSTQNGNSIIDGQNARGGLSLSSGDGVIASVDHFIIQNSYEGVGLSGASLTLTNSEVRNNFLYGGIDTGSSTTLVINNSTIDNNTNQMVYEGGGISNGGTTIITNSTIAQNDGYYGGGILNSGGQLTINNSTIVNNSGYTTGGIYGPATLHNTVLTNNVTTLGIAANCFGVTSADYNIIGTSCPIIHNPSAHDKIGVDPLLSPGQVGFPPYFALLTGSPAIDAGDPAASTCPATDERGISRPQGAACDIGAYEYVLYPPEPAAFFGIASGSGQQVNRGNAFQKPLVAYVIDSNGNPVQDVSVTFTASAFGASGTFATFDDSMPNIQTVITDSSGIATSSTFTANSQIGSYNVVATTALGLAGSANFNLLNYVWFVTPTGGSNGCNVISSPCVSINAVFNQPSFQPGDEIRVAAGTYNSVYVANGVTVSKNARISGGWDSTFNDQNGTSVFDWQVPGVYQVPHQFIVINSGITATIDHFTIQDGNSSTAGGGIASHGNLTLTNSTIFNNSSSDNGGGIYSDGTQLTILNSTISNNIGQNDGGGIYVNAGTATLNNDTIFQNTAVSITTYALGGGISAASSATVNVSNSIIAGNGSDLSPDCYGVFTSAGNNLIGDDNGCTFNATSGDLVGTHNNPINPQLGALINNGGSTLTHALLSGSPAIDAGNNATCESTDQRGVTRPQGVSCDIGAYEGVDTSQVSTPVIRTFNAGNQQVIPGNFACDQSTPCTEPDAASVQNYTTLMQQFYLSKVGRNGIDGNNAPFISTVHFDSRYPDAFWSGAQMVYGDAYPFAYAPDVIGHELTHGVTQYGSNLYEYYQSGAIDESLSDIWGEAFKQAGGPGGTPQGLADPQWNLGVDVTGLGPFRSMSNPPAFKDPDKMTSPYYDFDLDQSNFDGGGVHHNSGINNKAAYLMMEGGVFNNKTVTALGIDKTLAIYYEVQMNLLTSGANYLDLYNALYQGCLDIVGTHSITAADCQQVRNASDAVQMNAQPKANYIPSASYCPTGKSKVPTDLFYDGFENGLGNWNLGANAGSQRWSISNMYASSGVNSLYGDDYDPTAGDQNQTSDSFAAMASSVSLPAGSTPYLYFKQAFGFEYYGGQNYDGGVLEYSIDNGTTWKDAKALFSAGQNYSGTIFTVTTNPAYFSYNDPLHGRSGFVKDSHGYVSSEYNLTSLAGKAVMLRWRLGTDFIGYGDLGWNVDDVRIYQCVANPSVPGLSLPANAGLITTYLPTLSWKASTPAQDTYELQVSTDKTFTSIPLLDIPSSTSLSYTFTSPLPSNVTYYWRVRATNLAGQASAWSAVWSFRTALLPPTLSLPASGTYVQTTFPTLTWSDPNASGVTGYTIQISKNNTFTSIVTTGSSTTTSYTPAKVLPVSSTLYWRVQTKGANGPSLWSASPPVWSFTTGNPPSIPVPLSPANNSLTTSYNPPIFSWKPSTAPSGTTFDHYQIQIATDSAFSTPTADTTTTPTYPSSLTLNPNITYYWHVRAYNTIGDFSGWSATWSLRAAMLPPTLSAPADAADPLTLRPTFSWDTVPGVSDYSIQVSKNNTFTQIVLSGLTTATNLTPTKDLPAASVAPTLYWHVQALGPNGPSLWSSPTWTIVSPNPPSVPVLTSPVNASLSSTYQPTLIWKLVALPSLPVPTTFAHYHVQVSTSSTFASTPVVDDTSLTTLNSTQLLVAPALNPNTTYYWHVSAVNTLNEASVWSATWSFRTLLQPPTLLTPTNNATGVALRPTFTWSDSNTTGVSGYTIQISKSSTFASILVTGNTNATTKTFTPTTNLTSGTQYFWRVQVKGANGPSSWPTYFSFSTP